ncbi:hypothetical protein ACY3NT_003150 [Enterobacter sichuanensis]
MFKIDISLKGSNNEINSILNANGIVVSGKIHLPFVIESDNNRSLILIGEVNSYNGNLIDIKTAAKQLFINQAKQTDFYGAFICLDLSPGYVSIYTDPFGQFPAYYTTNTKGSISISAGGMFKRLSLTDPNIDVDFIFDYIRNGCYLKGKTVITGVNFFLQDINIAFHLMDNSQKSMLSIRSYQKQVS